VSVLQAAADIRGSSRH